MKLLVKSYFKMSEKLFLNVLLPTEAFKLLPVFSLNKTCVCVYFTWFENIK